MNARIEKMTLLISGWCLLLFIGESLVLWSNLIMICMNTNNIMSMCNICHRCHSRSVAQEGWMPRGEHICITISAYYKQDLVNILLLCNCSTGLTSTLILYLDKVTKVCFEQIFWKELENECKTKSPDEEFWEKIHNLFCS